jgi:hypothetical protein
MNKIKKERGKRRTDSLNCGRKPQIDGVAFHALLARSGVNARYEILLLNAQLLVESLCT